MTGSTVAAILIGLTVLTILGTYAIGAYLYPKSGATEPLKFS